MASPSPYGAAQPPPPEQAPGSKSSIPAGRRLLRRPSSGSQKERSSFGSSPSASSPSRSQKERGERGGGGPCKGDSSPLNEPMSPLDLRRLDRQKAQMWAVENEGECDVGARLPSPGVGGFHTGYTNLCRGTPSSAKGPEDDEIDGDSLAYHLELVHELPQIKAKLKSGDTSDMREAAEEVREMSRSTRPVLQQAAEAGFIPLLPPLLKHSDHAVVEPIVLAIANLAHKDAKYAKLLADEGVMALLSTVFVRAGEAKPRPQTSLQGNIAAAYLELFAALGTTRAGAMLTGQHIIQTLIQLAGPLSGRNYQGRRDALKLLMLLMDRPDVHTQLVSLGGAEAMVATVESGDDEIMEEVAEVMLLVAKSSEGVRRLCIAPVAAPRTPGQTEGSRRDETRCGDAESSNSEGRTEGREGEEREAGPQAPGVQALVKLLSPEYSPKTQESAASAILRMLTRGMADCARVVRGTEGLKAALERLQKEGAPKARRQANAILEALTIKASKN